MPSVDIIIPVYNHARTIGDTLRTLWDQTFKDFRVIIVNDGSTDGTQKVLAQVVDRATVLYQENRGSASARNTGFRESTAPFILFCDADVQFVPDALETMMSTLQAHPEDAFVYSDFYFGSKLFHWWPYNFQKLKKIPYIHTTSMIRREFFPGFDEELRRFQDWDLFLTMGERGYFGHWIDRPLYTINAEFGHISRWFPKWQYYLSFLPPVKAYYEAERLLKKKHGLV